MKYDYKKFKEIFEPENASETSQKKGNYKDNQFFLTNVSHFEKILGNVKNENIWTIKKGTDNSIYAIPGKHSHIKNEGFLITKKPYSQHHFENLKIILETGYEKVKPSDISYLRMIQERLKNKQNIVNFEEEIFNRIIKYLHEKL